MLTTAMIKADGRITWTLIYIIPFEMLSGTVNGWYARQEQGGAGRATAFTVRVDGVGTPLLDSK